MLTMELSEVVNPHFAFPVVGVVLCAFLVFAFGFKSSVQPPSFDAFDEEKKPRKTKHKKDKKSHSSDHVENHVSEKASTVQKQSSTKQSGIGKTTDKSPQPQKEAKSKVKKANTTKQSAPEVKKTVSLPPQEIEETGGWETVSVNKKKKNKNKRESDSETDQVIDNTRNVSSPKVALSVYNEPAIVSPPTDIPAQELEIPQPQRTKRDKAGKAKAKGQEKDLSDKENSPEPVSQDSTNEDVTIIKENRKAKGKSVGGSSSPDMQLVEAKVIQESPKAGPKKTGKKAKVKSGTDPTSQDMQLADVAEQIEEPEPAAKKVNKAKSKASTKAVQKEATLQNETLASVSNTAQAAAQSNDTTEFKTVKSPKNKKKKETTPLPVQDSTNTSLVTTSPATSSPSQFHVTSIPEKNDKSSVTSSDGPAQDATGAVTFDELGEWQDAKPTKKRKTKARRDN